MPLTTKPVAKKAPVASPGAAPAKKPASSTTKAPAKAGKSAAGAKKAVSGSKAGSKAGKSDKGPAEPRTMTEADVERPVTVQSAVRGWLARRSAARARAQRELGRRMEGEMEALHQAAIAAQVREERRKAAARAKATEEEEQRKREARRLTKALLEAAFEGDSEALVKLMAESEPYFPDPVDTADGHGNTLLSEACAGGDLPTVKLLLSRGADPNNQGEFRRTPLFRASFAGHVHLIAPLLEAGADPRVPNEFGELPDGIPTSAEIQAAIRGWDTSKTDAIRASLAERARAKAALAAEAATQRVATAEGAVAEAERGHEAAQMALKKALSDREKRIFEYDTSVEEQRPQSVLAACRAAIHDAEGAVERAREVAAKAAEALQEARLALRDSQQAQHGSTANGGASDPNDPPGLSVDLRDLGDVLIKDVGRRLEADGRWPAVVDASGRAGVFLKYADSNFAVALSPADMDPNRLRRSLLGALRYGKPFVVDMMDADMWDSMPRFFGAIHEGLWESLLSKQLLKDAAYVKLVRPEDGEEYAPFNFTDDRLSEFRFILLTSSRVPNADMLTRMCPIRVRLQGAA